MSDPIKPVEPTPEEIENRDRSKEPAPCFNGHAPYWNDDSDIGPVAKTLGEHKPGEEYPLVDLPGAPPNADLPFHKMPTTDVELCEGDIVLALRIFRVEGEIFPVVFNERKGWPNPHVFKMPSPDEVPALARLIHEISRSEKVIGTYFNPNRLKQTVQDDLAKYAVTSKTRLTRLPRGIDRQDFDKFYFTNWDIDAHDGDADNKQPSTVQQHQATIEAAKLLQKHLRARYGLPYPEIISSGNGVQAFTELEPFPADEEGKRLIKRFHKQIGRDLAEEFKKLGITFDEKVARVESWMRLAGTPNRKGVASPPGRLHAVARYIESPHTFLATGAGSHDILKDCRQVSRAELERIAGVQDRPSLDYVGAVQTDVEGCVKKYLSDEYHAAQEKPDFHDNDGEQGRCWEFRCAWNKHEDGSRKAYIIERHDGVIRAGCNADKCKGKGLRELLDAIDPKWKANSKLSALAVEPRILEIGTWAAETEERAVEWLWEGRLPRKQAVIIEGAPTTNKSTFCMTVAAHVSAGLTWPDGGSCEQGRVLYLSTEDSPATTIIPRMRVAGGLVKKGDGNWISIQRGMVFDVKLGQRVPLTIPQHLSEIERLIHKHSFRLVVFDPLVGYLDSSINSHNDSEIRRRAMDPLMELAERTGCTVLALRHWTKASDGMLMYLGGGSIGIIGAVRAGYAMVKLSDDKSDPTRVLWTVKNNLTPPGLPAPLLLRIDSVNETLPNGDPVSIAKITWLPGGEKITEDDLYIAGKKRGERGPSGDESHRAAKFLSQILSPAGTEKLRDEIMQAAEQMGISAITLRRAEDHLKTIGVVILKNGKHGDQCAWKLKEVI
jgi:hypothetical protein